MRYFKKRISLSLTFLLLFSLALGSLVTAEGQNNGGTPSVNPGIENSCETYSTNRDFVIANQSNIVVNDNSTATATFQTTQDCVKVSFSSYVAPPDWIVGPNDLTIPYSKQTHFEGQSIGYPKAGSYSITIKIPECLPYQLDIYSGNLLIHLGTGAHGDKIKAWKLKLQNTCTAATPTPTPTPTPTASPSPSPSASPETTPSASPETTPSASPETTPSASPETTPSASPETTPSASPETTPSASPETTPSASPETTPSASPETTPSVTPETTPSVTPETTPDTRPPASPPASPFSPTPTTFTTTVPSPTVSPSNSPTPTPTTIIEIDDDDTPVGGITAGIDDEIDTTDGTANGHVPLATLPKTGDTSPAPYYLLGAFAISTGYIALRKQRKPR